MTSTTALPVELIEQIMESLERDRRALLACSKLASSWRPGALARLFRSIQLRDGFSVFSFGITRVYGPTYFAQFQETMPHLLLYLRHLTFSHSAPTIGRDLYDLACQLRLSPPYRVEGITFAGTFDWHNALHDLATRFPNLQRLTIENFWKFLPRTFPALNATYWDIGLAYMASAHTNMQLSAAFATQTSLQSVTLQTRDKCSLGNLGTWLSALHGSAPNLQSVEIVQRPQMYIHKDSEDIASFVAATTNCRHLIHTIKLHSNSWDCVSGSPLNIKPLLEHCRRLRVLGLEISHRRTDFNSRRATLPQIIGPFPSLERLTITLNHGDPSADVYVDLPEGDWHALEGRLLSDAPRFACLLFVIAPFSPRRNAIWREGILRSSTALLSRLQAAGKLDVVVVNS